MSVEGLGYWDHALKRMQQRRISKQEVELVVADPQLTVSTYPNHKTGAKREKLFRKLANGKRLQVIVEWAGTTREVVTVAWS